MRRLMFVALLAGATAIAHGQDSNKKELVEKLLVLQQPGIEQVSRGLVERPAVQMMQQVAPVIQQRVAPDKREALGKQIEAEVKKYVEESVPLVRERAIKLAPSTIGPILEEKFSEDELKQLIAWFDSPVNRKYQQLGPEMQNAFVQKLVPDARPLVDPKLQALETRVRALIAPAVAPASGAAPGPARAGSGASSGGAKGAAK